MYEYDVHTMHSTLHVDLHTAKLLVFRDLCFAYDIKPNNKINKYSKHIWFYTSRQALVYIIIPKNYLFIYIYIYI